MGLLRRHILTLVATVAVSIPLSVLRDRVGEDTWLFFGALSLALLFLIWVGDRIETAHRARHRGLSS